MNRATVLRDLAGTLAVALLVNGLAAGFVTRPGYMDAYYYFGGALRLARGHGFSEPYAWNYLAPFRALPQPSHLYWMPMTSIVAAPFIVAAERLAGVQLPNDTLFRAVQIPFVGLASALPLLSYAVAALTTRLRRHALAAASLTVFTGFYLGFWPNTDAFALYGLAGGGALLACGLARSRMLTHPHQSQRWIFLAGVLTGLAHLSRADGVLILLVVLGMTLHAGTTADAHATSHASARRIRLAAVFLALTGYSLIMFPWFVRNLLVVGTPLAPGGARVLWLIAYDDLFSYPADSLTAARYLAAGWGAILAGKWWALQVNLGTLLGPHTTIVAFPFALIGLWRSRRNELYAPAIVYYLALFGVMTLVFTFPGARGGLFHSGTALLPFFIPAALRGVDVCVEAVARRRPAWRADEAKWYSASAWSSWLRCCLR